MSKLKFVGAVMAAFLPCNWMRVLAYRLLLGYKIEGGGSVLGRSLPSLRPGWDAAASAFSTGSWAP